MKQWLAAAGLSLFLGACGSPSSVAGMHKAVLVSPEGKDWVMQVEIADDPEEQALGLMYRTELAPDTGMLFIFPEERPLSFWMKNTLIPLDIIYFDAEGEFISKQNMIPCKNDPCPNYPSLRPGKFALEIASGRAAEHGIGTGWTLQIP